MFRVTRTAAPCTPIALFALLLPLWVAACVGAQEKPPPKPPAAAGLPRPVLDEVESRTLDELLLSLGCARKDLGYPKETSRTMLGSDQVSRFLADPLKAPAFAERFSERLGAVDRPVALPRLCASVLVRDLPHLKAWRSILPDEKLLDDASFWAVLFRSICPKGTALEEKAAEALALPKPARRVILGFVHLIPPADAAVVSAFSGLDADEKKYLAAYARILTIPADDKLAGYRPGLPGPEAARLARRFPGAPAKNLLEIAKKVRLQDLASALEHLCAFAEKCRSLLKESGAPEDFCFRLPARLGNLEVCGGGNHFHTDAAFVVDLGGDDFYVGSATAGCGGDPGRRLSAVIDMGGNDTYRAGDFSLGGALCGAALLWDAGGDDIYDAGTGSGGAGLFGCGMAYDGSGSDLHRGGDFSQGAGCFGLGIHFADQAAAERTESQGNDRYSAAGFSQGFSRTRGFGVLYNRWGQDVYTAGDQDPYLPQYKDRYFSHSQGFSIGVREHGAAGSIAMLVDEAGHDRYLGGVHCQGAACWYSAGFLVDRAGSDFYSGTFNAQGSAVHSAIGALLDGGGDDHYVLHHGLGQGCGHDYAAGLLLDRGGDDKYTAVAAAQGVGLTVGLGILADRDGDDTYAGHHGHLQGMGRPQGSIPSLGLLLDTGGRDTYRGTGRDGGRWQTAGTGGGTDLPQGAEDRREEGSLWKEEDIPEVELPEGYAFTRETFDTLFQKACAWNIGEAKSGVSRARGELVAWGERALPHLREKMKGWGGLLIWGLDAVVLGLSRKHKTAVETLVLEALCGSDSCAFAHALRLVVKLRLERAKPRILQLLNLGEAYWLYTFPAAGALRMAEAVPVLCKALSSSREKVVVAALGALSKIRDPAALPSMMMLLNGGFFTVRFAAARALSRMGAPARDPLLKAALDSGKPAIRRVGALRALEGLGAENWDAESEAVLRAGLGDALWVVRGWVARVYATLPDGVEPKKRLGELAGGERHPFVRGEIESSLALLALPPGERRRPRVRSGIVDYPEYLGEED
jgi:hypothetical protein